MHHVHGHGIHGTRDRYPSESARPSLQAQRADSTPPPPPSRARVHYSRYTRFQRTGCVTCATPRFIPFRGSLPSTNERSDSSHSAPEAAANRPTSRTPSYCAPA